MSFTSFRRALPLLAAVFPMAGAAAQNVDACQAQAERVVERLQADVFGELSADQQSRARRIVAEGCRAGVGESAAAPGQAAPQTGGEDETGPGFWSGESTDKPGNKRLERRGRY